LTKIAIASDVQSAVYDALLRNRRLDVEYLPRGANTSKQYELNPLGLVLKDGMFYLVCSMWDYPDARLLTLHRMNMATVMDLPCVMPDGFDLDEYIASGVEVIAPDYLRNEFKQIADDMAGTYL